MNRRQLFHTALAAGAAGLAQAQTADPEPHVDDIRKFPRCQYCGMDRQRFHHSRMLVHYSNGAAEGVCSIRCAASSLTQYIGRGTTAIWVGDNSSEAETKPLTDAEKATYLIGSSIRGVMTRRSKVAYSTPAAAEAAKAANGGELADFDHALLSAYTDIAESVAASRQTREERLKRSRAGQGK
jgi:copper chaperone NosL